MSDTLQKLTLRIGEEAKAGLEAQSKKLHELELSHVKIEGQVDQHSKDWTDLRLNCRDCSKRVSCNADELLAIRTSVNNFRYVFGTLLTIFGLLLTLQSNIISCNPPAKKPAASHDDTYHPHKHAIKKGRVKK